MMRWTVLLTLGLIGCPDPADDDPRPDAGAEGDADTAGPPTACDRTALAAQCPIGSAPRVITDGCAEGAEVIDDAGQTTGVCARAGECLFVCDFADPCPCGIDSINADRIVCTDCGEAAPCGDAICDRGETPDTCAIDCGEQCVARNERCDGNARQECEETGRWTTLACRADQVCQFGASNDAIVTVCQTRISMGGGTFAGLGESGAEAASSLEIRFRERSFQAEGVRFIEDGARVMAVRDGRIVIIDPTGERPDEDTGQFAGDALVAAEARIGRFNRNSRWPQLAEPFEQTSRTVEVMVHDAAEARRGAMAISADGALFAGGFAVGLKGAQRLEPVLGIWDATTGAIDGLLRFVDDAVVDSDAPATTVALSRNGQTAIEARPGGVLIVWNVAERRYVHLIQSDVGEVTQLIPSTAGDDLLVVGGGTGLELWSLGDDPPQRRWRVPLAGLTAAAIAPDSSAIAVAAAGQVELLDATDGAARFTFQPGERVRFLDFAPRGGRLMLGGVIYSSAL